MKLWAEGTFSRYLAKNLFTPPYPLLPLAAFALFVLCCVYYPLSPLRTGMLFDADDYMRLDQVVNWLKGQGWYDLSQPRLAPGEHTVIHWARLVDIPLALFALPFLKLGAANAAMIAAFIVPPLLFGLLVLLAPALARPFIGKGRANLASILALFLMAVTFNFTAGRADHHNYEILIGGFGLAALPAILFCRRGWITAILAAAAFACGLWISPEILPWIVFFLGALALLGALRGGIALRNAAVFGAALPLAVAVLLPIALRPEDYMSRAMSWFSGGDLVFAALGGGVLVFGWLLGRLTEKSCLRLALMAAAAFGAGTSFLAFAPDILAGPYASYDSFFGSAMLDNIGEARPFLSALGINRYEPSSFLRAAPLFLRSAGLPLIAVAVVLWNLAAARGRRRALWAAQALFLLPALLMTFFWESRALYFAQLFSLASLTFLLWNWWKRIGTTLEGRQRFWAEIAAFILVVPLSVIILPSLLAPTKLFPDILLFPAAHSPVSCPLRAASEYLDGAYKDHPVMILSGANEGPELLFRTPHNVLAALYDVKANRDVYDFFNDREGKTALEILQRRKVDLVLVCRHISYLYAGLGSREARVHADLSTDKNGNLHFSSNLKHPTLMEKLVNGDAPAWLKPIVIPFDPDYLLFEVKRP